MILFSVLKFLPINVYAQDEATGSSDTIREKVKEKLNRAMNKPKAYIGSITDITDTNIQISNLEGEIQQIMITPDETTYANVADSEELEFSEVAIGDQIVAVGFIDENRILNCLRVLITSTGNSNERAIYNGEVVSIENKKITIKDNKRGEIQLTFPRRWKGPEIIEFEEGQRVTAVSINDDGVLTIRTIEIDSEITEES